MFKYHLVIQAFSLYLKSSDWLWWMDDTLIWCISLILLSSDDYQWIPRYWWNRIHPSLPSSLHWLKIMRGAWASFEHCTYRCLGFLAEEVSHRQGRLCQGWFGIGDDGWDAYSDDNTVDQQHDNSMMTSTLNMHHHLSIYPTSSSFCWLSVTLSPCLFELVAYALL